ncbi:MAG: four-carbon acid sugar kinase family protein [Mangrovibacterium sp.]
MIAVIADDFTGAAEIGGVGLQRGLKVQVETEVSGAGKPDLLVISADTRSMNLLDACTRIEQITTALLQLKPRVIYKKIDSVLRGHVYDELEVQRCVSGKNRILVVPANPHFKRIIRDGIYYIDEIPLGETSFANDPEFPHNTSKVAELIGKGSAKIACFDFGTALPNQGFVVGNVTNDSDLAAWAAELDEQTVYAGGAGYFQAILDREYPVRPLQPRFDNSGARHSLFVFGSTFPKDSAFITKLEEAGLAFYNLSETYFNEAITTIARRNEMAQIIAGQMMRDSHVVLTTIFSSSANANISPQTVRAQTGLLVKAIFDRVPVDSLFIEGGATASQIFQNLGIARLIPVCELDYGIIQMKVEDSRGLMVVTKPGSYQWPDCIVPRMYMIK